MTSALLSQYKNIFIFPDFPNKMYLMLQKEMFVCH